MFVNPLTPTAAIWVQLQSILARPDQPWASECPDVKNYNWLLNPVWYRMLYSCTHMATMGVIGLIVYHENASYRRRIVRPRE